jgi:hypothetical protein
VGKSRAAAGFLLVFHKRKSKVLGRTTLKQPSRGSEIRDGYRLQAIYRSEPAPNPVRCLWSSCTRLHSQQIQVRVFH